MLQGFLLTLSFFTRLPLPKHRHYGGMALAEAVWAFPLAGALVGALAGLVYMLALRLGLGHGVAGWLTLGALVLLTGGLHEDGLADMADGMAYGRDREQKLAIMRDSRIGSYGVLALVIVSAVRASAIADLPYGFPALAALIAAGACSRACIGMLMHILPAARSDGLAAQAGQPSAGQAGIAILLSLPALALTAKPQMAALAALALMVLCMLVGRIAMKQFGGITGDVLGALQQLGEAAVLVVLSI